MALPYSNPQQEALTYGKRKIPFFTSDIITAQASELPSLYALKEREKQQEEGQALEKEAITSAENIAAQEREVEKQGQENEKAIAERRNELEDLISRRTISQNERIAEENRKLAEREAEVSKVLGVGGLAISGVSAAKELWPDWSPSGFELARAGLGAGAGYYLTRKKKPE